MTINVLKNKQIFLRATEIPAFSLVFLTPVKPAWALALVCFRSGQRFINLALYRVLSLGERLNRWDIFLYFTAVAAFTVFGLTYFRNILCSFKIWQEVTSVMITNSCILALGPVHMIPGQLIAQGQLNDPGVNFASVHGLTPVTVHMSFSLPRSNFERRVTRCTTPGNPPCRGNFSPCGQKAKVAPGQE